LRYNDKVAASIQKDYEAMEEKLDRQVRKRQGKGQGKVGQVEPGMHTHDSELDQLELSHREALEHLRRCDQMAGMQRIRAPTVVPTGELRQSRDFVADDNPAYHYEWSPSQDLLGERDLRLRVLGNSNSDSSNNDSEKVVHKYSKF
jgi:hypothetical protein